MMAPFRTHLLAPQPLLLLLLLLLLCSTLLRAFSPATTSFGVRQYRTIPFLSNNADHADLFLDVEFEKVTSSSTDTNNNTTTTTIQSSQASSLLEMSLDMDPQWKQARIPFVQGHNAIDCHVAFTIVDDTTNVTYGIGVPCDAAVAITMEQENTVTYLNPNEHEEMVQVMASKLQELLGDDVYLRSTPKILTVTGNLNQYTNNWKDNLFPDTVSTEELLNDSNEGLDFFYNFMRNELGEEEFQKTLDECQQDGASIDKDVLDLFNIPGLGDQSNDIEGIKAILNEMLKEQQQGVSENTFTEIGQDLEHDGVALKLIGFNFRDGKSYSLVKLLKAFTIVGKYAESDKEDLRFDLLTPEEEKIVIPWLEQVCRKDLEQAGLSLQ